MTPIIISVYNHKSGVGKTTATYNIAYVLREIFGRKVLLVDIDSNRTAFYA